MDSLQTPINSGYLFGRKALGPEVRVLEDVAIYGDDLGMDVIGLPLRGVRVLGRPL
jgi:hypothetical protein